MWSTEYRRDCAPSGSSFLFTFWGIRHTLGYSSWIFYRGKKYRLCAGSLKAKKGRKKLDFSHAFRICIPLILSVLNWFMLLRNLILISFAFNTFSVTEDPRTSAWGASYPKECNETFSRGCALPTVFGWSQRPPRLPHAPHNPRTPLETVQQLWVYSWEIRLDY